jgi:hypothetical protein
MRIHREIIIRTVESVFCHGVEEDRALMAVERGRLLEDEGGHRFDVEHRNILSMELGLLHVLVLGKTTGAFLCPGSGCPGLGGGCFGCSLPERHVLVGLHWEGGSAGKRRDQSPSDTMKSD